MASEPVGVRLSDLAAALSEGMKQVKIRMASDGPAAMTPSTLVKEFATTVERYGHLPALHQKRPTVVRYAKLHGWKNTQTKRNMGMRLPLNGRGSATTVGNRLSCLYLVVVVLILSGPRRCQCSLHNVDMERISSTGHGLCQIALVDGL